jgi:hypothetical protein
MPSPKPHNRAESAHPGSIPDAAADWGRQFLKHLELAYADSASSLEATSGWEDFRQAMLLSFVETLRDSGAAPAELMQLMTAAIDRLSPQDRRENWTSHKNARRVELIDKQIQHGLSYDEVIELARLTTLMRAQFDQEEFVPLEGVRRLHRRLVSDEPEQPNA